LERRMSSEEGDVKEIDVFKQSNIMKMCVVDFNY
jgi:hypothetical protein